MIGRTLFVGLSTNDKKIIKKLILDCHVSGLTFYSRNYRNYEEMLKLINYIHELAEKAGYTILVGIDEEGYRVNRLPKEIVNLKSPYSFHHDLELVKHHGKIIATILSESNININFAPVLDIKRFPDNHPIGDRCFGNDASSVIKNTIPYIKELQNRNVISVVKHFPGHGATNTNSHYFIPVIWNTKKLMQEDILPFKEAIKQGCDAIMVGHFLIPKFSFIIPTSFSKKTVQFLRNDCGFQNLIITDDIYMGLLKLANKSKIIKKAINHGFNIIMVKYYDGFFKDYAKLQKWLNQNKINQDNINQSIKLIDSMITKYHITNKSAFNTLNINKINDEITKLNQNAN